jgi:hypothetical protein
VTLAKEARALSRAEYLAKHPEHVFVVSAFALTESGYETSGEGEQGKTVTIWPIRKTTTGSPLPNLVTIGRASSNDIQLRARSVSKFHAHLERDDAGVWHIVDSNSTFGTYVAEAKVPPGTKTPLRSGDRLRLGNLNLTYYDPERIYDVFTKESDVDGVRFEAQT